MKSAACRRVVGESRSRAKPDPRFCIFKKVKIESVQYIQFHTLFYGGKGGTPKKVSCLLLLRKTYNDGGGIRCACIHSCCGVLLSLP